MGRLTVKELKKALEGVPDNLIVELCSDTGVDECEEDDLVAIIEEAYVENETFVIYANYGEEVVEEEEEE